MSLSKDQEQIYIEMVRKDPLKLYDIKDQTESICFEAVRQDGRALYHVKEESEKVCLEAIKENPEAIADTFHYTEEMLFEFVRMVNKDNIFPFDNNYYFVDELEGELNILYNVLDCTDKIKSYRQIRYELVSQQLILKKSPYHVLEQLYSN